MGAMALATVDEAARHDRLAARRRLRMLDACLNALEDANERGETVLSAQLAARLRVHVRELHAGMATAEALEHVFERQHVVMLGYPVLDSMTEVEARTITRRIRSGVGHVSMLLLEAHERRAWAVLGYPTWEEYVRQELGLSRTRSYELVYHGQVIRKVQAVSGVFGVFGIPNISPYAAIQIKAHIDEVTEALRVRMMQARTQADAAAIVAEVVEEARASVARRPATANRPPCAGRREVRVDRRRLMDAVAYLAEMPQAAEVVAHVDLADQEGLLLIRRAARWLTELSDACNERRKEAGHVRWGTASHVRDAPMSVTPPV